MRYLLLILLSLALHPAYIQSSAFFQASPQQPYHLSIGAVLFNEEGRIACHHFEQILGNKDIYILMRESMEDGETIPMTLERGLREEFGARATPVAFLGCLSGFLYDPCLPFEKTTLYIACRVTDWDPTKRDPNDPEACSTIEWLEPSDLIAIMQAQGKRFGRVDADESEMVLRALAYTKGH